MQQPVTAKPTLWHCYNARSMRALWALEELGMDYDVHTLAFPPRAHHPEYKDINLLGTVPYFVDGETTMTESSGICFYLVERYQRHDLGLKPDHPEYGDYLNWLFHSDATLTFPQTLVLRYSALEPKARRQPQVAEDYRLWFLGRLKKLNAHLLDHPYLCDERFTIADIAVAYALWLGHLLGLSKEYSPQVASYLERMQQRPAFIRCQSIDPHLDPYSMFIP